MFAFPQYNLLTLPVRFTQTGTNRPVFHWDSVWRLPVGYREIGLTPLVVFVSQGVRAQSSATCTMLISLARKLEELQSGGSLVSSLVVRASKSCLCSLSYQLWTQHHFLEVRKLKFSIGKCTTSYSNNGVESGSEQRVSTFATVWTVLVLCLIEISLV